MIDLKNSFYGHTDVLPLTTGAVVSEEGCGLVAVLENGVETVRPPVLPTDATAKVAGFAVFRQLNFATAPCVENLVVPTSAPYSVQLTNTNLVLNQVRVHDVVANADFTIVLAPGAVAPGSVVVDLKLGTLTFDISAAGHTIAVTYQYNLTVAQAKLLFYEAPTNYPDPNYFASVGVGKGKGRIFTSFFDASCDFSTGAALHLGAGGIITTAAVGPMIPNARVVQLPISTVPNTNTPPTLGVEFLL